MMDSPSVYSNIISPRSRRLRTIGIVLIAAAALMGLYGYFGLMPNIERSLREHPIQAVASPGGATSPAQHLPPALARAQRARKFQVAVALAYWGVCSLLILGVLVVAWLDLREISNRYVSERRAMWGAAVEQVEKLDDSG